jgi:hypothetical protein
MFHLTQSVPTGRDLHVCPACRRPFVAPSELLACYDDGQHVVELTCTNCGWWAYEVHSRAGLDELDRACDRDSAHMAAAAEVLALACELERIDQFAAALHAGHILPEDF